ncbi:MAG: hypothetical protein MUW56_02310 [Chryseobacterium sp.]|uniref:hypothetical protein n=1 Tax=Chryseobacterium sp. TaxID=1871047 RepID=UPI0025B8F5AC|nr:hypothetical protein [Chryseobacterium sp.]MCJ7932483.1 hypothetical protein [Chryseobacterium sp.]
MNCLNQETSYAGNDETINHLEKIIVLYPDISSEFEKLRNEYNILGGTMKVYKNGVKKTGMKIKNRNNLKHWLI